MVVPTAVTGLVVFGLFAGAPLVVDADFGIWWTLSLAWTGAGAAGSAALLVSRRLSVSSVRQRRLLTGTQLCLLPGSMVASLSSFDHSGFRGLVLPGYVVIFGIGFVVLVSATASGMSDNGN